MKPKGDKLYQKSPSPWENSSRISFQQEQGSIFYLRLCILALLGLFLFSPPLLAQNPPPGEGAGAQAERFLKETEKQREEGKKRIQPAEIEFKKEKEEKITAPPIYFTLRGIRITGNTVFKTEELDPIYQDYLNKKISLSDLEPIVEKIKNKYYSRGYLTTTVYIPEQEVINGIVEIRIVEGKIGKLKIEGGRWFRRDLIEKWFHSKKNEVLNIKKIQRDLLRLNQFADLGVKALIAAGEEPETSDITLKVEDKFSWHLGAGADNQGARLVGRIRSLGSLRSSNFSGRLDTLFVNSAYTTSSWGRSLSYILPVGTYGTKIGFDGVYFNLKYGKEFKSFCISGESQIYNLFASWEILLDEASELGAVCGIEIKSIKKKAAGRITSDDQLRIPYIEFDFDRNFPGGQLSFAPRLSFSTGHFLGASSRNHPSAGRPGTGGFFVKYEHTISGAKKLFYDPYLLWRSQFQIASHTLPSSEQLQLGGAFSIRGYPEGDYLADLGGALSLDWVFPSYFIPAEWKIRNARLPLRHQIEPVVFMDIGGGKLKKVVGQERQFKFLSGFGGGLRFNFGRIFSLRLDWAKHVGDRPSGGSGPSNFYFTFRSEI